MRKGSKIVLKTKVNMDKLHKKGEGTYTFIQKGDPDMCLTLLLMAFCTSAREANISEKDLQDIMLDCYKKSGKERKEDNKNGND